jgi:hypothetical protein
MPQFLGRATIRVDGDVIETAKGAMLDIGGVKRTSVTVGRVVGYAEETVPAVLECETALRPGMSVARLGRLTNAVVVFECDTGQRYVMNDAFTTDTPTLKDGEGGNVTLKMEGPGAEEVL